MLGMGLKVSGRISTGLLALVVLACAAPRSCPGAPLAPSSQRLTPPLVPPGSASADRAKQRLARVIAAQLPLSFEANRGQADGRVKFLSRGSLYALFLGATDAVLSLSTPSRTGVVSAVRPLRQAAKAEKARPAVLRMEIVGGNRESPATGLEPLPGKVSYFIGKDRKKWLTSIPTFAKVRCRAVYPGVDLVYYGKQQQLEYDFIVAPGRDPRSIRLRMEGARHVRIDRHGDLLVETAAGAVRWQKPVIYQRFGGTHRRIAGRYVTHGKQQIGFQVAAFDHRRPLIIDPVLAFSSFLGGAGQDNSFGIAVDGLGNAYLTGFTSSTDFPTANALEPQFHGHSREDGFVAKIDTIHSVLLYSTYFGGESTDWGLAIAVDSAGSAYVTGLTQSTDFPTVNALDSTLNQDGLVANEASDAFALKLSPTGSALLYSTYLGGSGSERGTGIAVDAAGSAYVTGWANSSALAGAVSFVCKLSPAGSALVYSTYLSGFRTGSTSAIAVDASCSAYVAGSTASYYFSTQQALQTVYGGGPSDAFVAKLDPTGSVWVYATYLGGGGRDEIAGIAVDAAGNAYVAGTTTSPNFPVVNALQPRIAGKPDPKYGYISDVFVARLNPAGSALTFATYLGGSGQDWAGGIALDAAGNIYVAGGTQSPDFPLVNALQPLISGPDIPNYGFGPDVFVAKLDNPGSRLIYSTYLGGKSRDAASGIAVDHAGAIYLTGSTSSTDFPLVRPIQSELGGGIDPTQSDAFVVKISDSAPPPPADGLPPTTQAITIPAPNDHGWNNTPVSVDLMARDEGGSGVKAIRYVLTGAQTGSGLISGSHVSLRVVNDGVSVLTYSAVDAAGNQESVHTLPIRVDATPPSGAITATPSRNAFFWNNLPVALQVHASDNPGGSGAKEIHYTVLGPQYGTGIASGDTLSLTITANGTTGLIAYAVDNAGNQGLPVETTLLIDQVPPVTVATANPPPDASGGNSTPVTVTLQATDMSIPYLMQSGVKEVHYTLTGAQTGSGVVPGDHARVDVTADGVTTLTYFAVDFAGNQESPKSLTLRIAGAGSP